MESKRERIVYAQCIDHKLQVLRDLAELKQKDFTGSGLYVELKDLSGDAVLSETGVVLSNDVKVVLDVLEKKIIEDIKSSTTYILFKKFIEKYG